jgi:hypothetical protein
MSPLFTGSFCPKDCDRPNTVLTQSNDLTRFAVGETVLTTGSVWLVHRIPHGTALAEPLRIGLRCWWDCDPLLDWDEIWCKCAEDGVPGWSLFSEEEARYITQQIRDMDLDLLVFTLV